MPLTAKSFLRATALLAFGILLGTFISPGAEGRAGTVAAAAPAVVPFKDTVPCHHDETSVWQGCEFMLARGSVESVTLTVQTRAKRIYTLRIKGGRADAIFLTKGGAENFLARYYTAVRKTRELNELNAKLSVAQVLP